MRIIEDIKLDYSDVLFQPKRSKLESRRDVDIMRTFTFHNSDRTFQCLPIMASNMDGVGTFSMAKVLQQHKMMTIIRKHYKIEDWQNAVGHGLNLKYLSVCTGTAAIWKEDAEDYALAKEVLKRWPDIKFITIDVANAYHQNYADFVARVRNDYPDKIIIAGNIITPEMVEELIIKGADIIKCGIGPGSVCITRSMTGVGVPQFSGVMECADAAHGVGGHIIADGGCNTPGDVSKAFGAGADFVMLGGMLAAHEESELQLNNNNQFEFYGMASDTAMEKYGRKKDGYRGSEGKKVLLNNRGPVEPTVVEIIGGVRSTCTYIGARRIKDMPKCATFVRVNNVANQVYSQYDK
jgi:GMP reductase